LPNTFSVDQAKPHAFTIGGVAQSVLQKRAEMSDFEQFPQPQVFRIDLRDQSRVE